MASEQCQSCGHTLHWARCRQRDYSPDGSYTEECGCTDIDDGSE